jgi:Fe-S oxidoreductase
MIKVTMIPAGARSVLDAVNDQCIQCDACFGECDVFDQLGMDPAQIVGQVLEGDVAPEVVDWAQKCALCGLCMSNCPFSLDFPKVVESIRQVLAANDLMPLDALQGLMTDQKWNVYSLYREANGVNYDDLKSVQDAPVAFFPGCVLGSYAPEVTRAAYAWLAEREPKVGFCELCCGKTLEMMGLAEREEQWVDKLEAALQAQGVERLVVACPNCYYQLKGHFQKIRVQHIYELMAAEGVQVSGEGMLTVHDSCPDRVEGAVGGWMRQILGGYPQVEMTHHGASSICCGSGGLVGALSPELADERAQTRLAEFQQSGAQTLVTGCMTCAQRLSASGGGEHVVHILELTLGKRVDRERIQAQEERMWEGGQGEANLQRLAEQEPALP